MASQWYVQHGGKQYGPLTSANLKKLADEGKISPATSVRAGSEGAWVPAARVQGLFSAARDPSAATNKSAAGTSAATNSAAVPRASVVAPPVAPPPPPPVGSPLPRAVVTPVARLPKAVPIATGSMAARILGAVALILGILALATFWLPLVGGPMGWIGIVVGALGLALGVGGLVLAAMHHGSGLALGIAGTSSSVVGLVLAVVLGIKFNLFASAPEPPPRPIVAAKPVVAPPEPPKLEAPPPKERQPEPEPVWTPASQPIEQGNIKARVVSAIIEQVRLEATDPSTLKRQKPQPMLKIRVAIENTSTDKIVEFAGWMGGGDLVGQGVAQLLGGEAGKAIQSATATAALVDNTGNKYKQTSLISIFGAQLTVGQDNTIRPGKSAESELVFPRPLETIEYLRLELSGAAFSGDEPLRFQIPRAMVTGL